MFKLLKDPLAVWWPVKITVPTASGEPEHHEIKLQYRVPLDLRAEGPLSQAPLADLIIGWEGVADHTGAPLEFTEDHKAALLANPFVFRAAGAGLAAIYAGEFTRGN
jgi:hypothetical protein